MEYDREFVLTLCRDLFIQDFDFNDVYKDLVNANVLPPSELEQIRSCKRDEQIDRLFFLIVIRAEDIFREFVDQLRKTYSWLAVEIERKLHQLRMNHQGIVIRNEFYYEKITNLRKELPKFVDFNIHRCEWVNTNLIHFRRNVFNLNIYLKCLFLVHFPSCGKYVKRYYH